MALVFNDDYANDCLGAIIEKSDYHSDDYQFYAADNLLIDTTVPGKSAFLMGSFCVNLVSSELFIWGCRLDASIFRSGWKL